MTKFNKKLKKTDIPQKTKRQEIEEILVVYKIGRITLEEASLVINSLIK